MGDDEGRGKAEGGGRGFPNEDSRTTTTTTMMLPAVTKHTEMHMGITTSLRQPGWDKPFIVEHQTVWAKTRGALYLHTGKKSVKKAAFALLLSKHRESRVGGGRGLGWSGEDAGWRGQRRETRRPVVFKAFSPCTAFQRQVPLDYKEYRSIGAIGWCEG